MSKLKKRKAGRLLAGFICVLILVTGSLYAARRAMASEYRTFQSPDGKYRIVVYDYPMLISSVGGGGDAPGFVRLYDNRGRVLGEEDVEMVNQVDQIYWDKDKVDVKLVAEWRLPTE